MKTYLPNLFFLAVFAVSLPVYSCIAEDEKPAQPVGPVDGDNPDIGIKYDDAQGLFVTPFSAKLLGLKMADVDEREITSTLTLQARIFNTSSAKSALASAWLPAVEANLLAINQPAQFKGGHVGRVTSISSDINGQTEVILSINDPEDGLKNGKFLAATLTIESDGPVTVVPERAIIDSAEGTFAYVDNGGWTVRTPVETGARSDGNVEIVDGLYFGDRIVTEPTMALWMTELQLLKSGKA